MADPMWNILLVEDSEDDYLLTRDFLTDAKRGQFRLDWAKDVGQGLELLDSCQPDVLLVDYQLDKHTGLDFVRAARSRGCRSPIILLTGHSSYELDVESMKAGVSDFLEKNLLSGPVLERTIRYAIERQASQERLERMNEELETRVQERTRELSEIQSRLIDGAEAERLELARELHDGPIQDLYGLSFQLHALRAMLPDGENNQILAGLEAGLQRAIDNLRATSVELRPPVLARFGLEAAIRSHSEQFQKAQPDLDIHLDLQMEEGPALSERARLVFYRIYQVALTNVARHAQAHTVTIRLRANAETVLLEICDDGKGFRVPERWVELARQGHLGLVGANERVEALGGTMQVRSRPGAGTIVRVTIPRQV